MESIIFIILKLWEKRGNNVSKLHEKCWQHLLLITQNEAFGKSTRQVWTWWNIGCWLINEFSISYYAHLKIPPKCNEFYALMFALKKIFIETLEAVKTLRRHGNYFPRKKLVFDMKRQSHGLLAISNWTILYFK